MILQKSAIIRVMVAMLSNEDFRKETQEISQTVRRRFKRTAHRFCYVNSLTKKRVVCHIKHLYLINTVKH